MEKRLEEAVSELMQELDKVQHLQFVQLEYFRELKTLMVVVVEQRCVLLLQFNRHPEAIAAGGIEEAGISSAVRRARTLLPSH